MPNLKAGHRQDSKQQDQLFIDECCFLGLTPCGKHIRQFLLHSGKRELFQNTQTPKMVVIYPCKQHKLHPI